MRMKYIGHMKFRILHGQVHQELNHGDVIDVDPWKIRGSRLYELFEVDEDDHTKVSKQERRFLDRSRGRLRGVEKLDPPAPPTEEEFIAEVADKAERAGRGEKV